jgi:uncharacterized membrane protein YdjX (TVP38/TMEM64 family)
MPDVRESTENPTLPSPRSARSTLPSPRTARSWLIVGAVVVALVAVWRFTPLTTLLDRGHLAALGRALAASPAAPLIVIAAFVAGALVLFPVTPLLAATALVFDPWRALALGLGGALTAAAMTWCVGRIVARFQPRWIEAPRFAPWRARLRRRGITTMAVSRLLPVGNFTLQNVAAGAIGIRFRDFMIGNGLGLLVPLLAFTVLSQTLHQLGWTS